MNDESGDYARHIEEIKQAATCVFEQANTEDDVCRLEQMIHNEIMYVAAIAQAKRVMPPEGWDPFGR